MSGSSPGTKGRRPVEPSDSDQDGTGQPYLHEARVLVRAPSLVLSGPDGDLHTGVDGFFHADIRALSVLRVTPAVGVLAPIQGELTGADEAVFRAVVRGVGQHGADPAVLLTRWRSLRPGVLTERLELRNGGRERVRCPMTVTAGTDLAGMQPVKLGQPGTPVTPRPHPEGLEWSQPDRTVRLSSEPKPDSADDATLRYEVELAPGETWTCTLTCTVTEQRAPLFYPADPPARPPLRVQCGDDRFSRLIERSMSDLGALLLADPENRGDVFVAAGAPWFLTLFGRDSLWVARMLLPVWPEIAAGTLRTLARRQGLVVDAETEEQPGKILHEIRSGALPLGDGAVLPPRYYGSIDSTLLWVILLHDAWRWGMPLTQVQALLPALRAACSWLLEFADPDGDGFLEYIDQTGRGLANQGWKDSGDSIQFRDGRLAKPPIALCEVQAYAYEAALAGATVLRAFGTSQLADRLEERAAKLRSAFRSAFWIRDAAGPYPAVALDGGKHPVDTVTSNLGHLLGTGLLDRAESAMVAGRLAGLDAGFGLRTLAADSAGFNPLGYHTGSIWPHDTAIAAFGLRRAGFGEQAARLAHGVIAASVGFDARLPELYAGDSADRLPQPAPYPAACRPQAWAAGGVVMLLQALLGLTADVPGGVVRVKPMVNGLPLPLRVEGLWIAGQPLRVAIDADGSVSADSPGKLRVVREVG